MHTGHALLITLLSLGLSPSAWSSADTGHANSNANSREVASALGGLKTKPTNWNRRRRSASPASISPPARSAT